MTDGLATGSTCKQSLAQSTMSGSNGIAPETVEVSSDGVAIRAN